ncbi:uncharacterized protein BP01DRAFT_381527 [Aspergillus saccharolyticus JOP 1030-1]|uniref:Uncharacterized protein n=1 Tax=Aspergillus saccharolyticus JOP 1030-1 TaxID=1450539 RepID=A0A318ZFZ3_9EURO|nr:hypothetical protein BP01DRAFT_381527 [Aspergillus saccharolyticus JOP 1030-1]PYH46471.1 hypothetical protein BP01DRAFT_381527 [Aspergillus saccharolyticus JOP 1030-1]
MPRILPSGGKPTPAARSGNLDDTFEIDAKYWSDLPYIYLSHRAIVEFCKREKAIAKEARAEQQRQRKKRTHHCRRQRLPHKLRSLKEFARGGGPDLSEVSSFGWSNTAEPGNSTSLYDRNCHNFFQLHGIAARPYSHNQPKNYPALQELVKIPRASVDQLDHTDHGVWLKCCKNYGKARSKLNDAVTILLGENAETVLTYENEPITGLEPLVEGMFQAQPDYYDCADYYALDKDGRIANDLKEYILPAADAYGVVPNFFVQLKFDDDDEDHAAGQLQAMHYGALGARAVQKLRFYGRDNEAWLDEVAYSIAVVVFERSVAIYAVHMIEPEDENREADYQLTLLYKGRMDGVMQFRKAVAAVRNSREFANYWREHFIEQARLALEGGAAGDARQGSPGSLDEKPSGDQDEGLVRSLSDGQGTVSVNPPSSTLKRSRVQWELQCPSQAEELRIKRPRPATSDQRQSKSRFSQGL